MAAGADDFPEKQFGNFIMAENLLIESVEIWHMICYLGAYFYNLFSPRALESRKITWNMPWNPFFFFLPFYKTWWWCKTYCEQPRGLWSIIYLVFDHVRISSSSSSRAASITDHSSSFTVYFSWDGWTTGWNPPVIHYQILCWCVCVLFVTEFERGLGPRLPIHHAMPRRKASLSCRVFTPQGEKTKALSLIYPCGYTCTV
jgi:hypothetical protein